jgi:hypothetical protein
MATQSKSFGMDISYDLRTEVELFMNMKGISLLEFSDGDWIYDFAILVDMTISEYLITYNCKERID